MEMGSLRGDSGLRWAPPGGWDPYSQDGSQEAEQDTHMHVARGDGGIGRRTCPPKVDCSPQELGRQEEPLEPPGAGKDWDGE